MKWFFGLVLAVALIAGALYGVGRFLLPETLMVTRAISVDRPRAAVFAMTNDLRIVKEWSPYYALDPDAEYTFSGDQPGSGQTMRWSSNVRRVGNGRMSIVSSAPNQEVQLILELVDRATLNARLELRPEGGLTNVAWSVSAQCAEGAINVPCRYMSLIMRSMIERDLDNGLSRLKRLTEQLPDVDFEGLDPGFDTVEPRAYVYSAISTSNHETEKMEEALRDGVNLVTDYMTRNNLVQAGPQIRVTTEWDAAAQRMSFRVGYPYSGPTPLNVVGVQVGQTPSGRALHVMHDGPRAQVRNTYAQIYAYLRAHRIAVREDGLPWEVLQSDGAPDGSTPAQIEIFVPLQ